MHSVCKAIKKHTGFTGTCGYRAQLQSAWLSLYQANAIVYTVVKHALKNNEGQRSWLIDARNVYMLPKNVMHSVCKAIKKHTGFTGTCGYRAQLQSAWLSLYQANAIVYSQTPVIECM